MRPWYGSAIASISEPSPRLARASELARTGHDSCRVQGAQGRRIRRSPARPIGGRGAKVGGQRLRVDRGHQRIERRRRLAALVEGARGPRRAVVEEARQRLLEASAWPARNCSRSSDRVHRPIEHHRPDPVREAVRVVRPDERAVGEPEVGQLLVADRLADEVEVLDDGVGRQIGQRRVVALGAFGGIVAGRIDQLLELGWRRPATDRARACGSRLSMQRISVLAFTPRGSKPTMSKRLRRPSGSCPDSPAARTNSTPDPPGPPGFTSSEPMRSLGSVAGRRRSETLR